jgi:hypothetical protein
MLVKTIKHLRKISLNNTIVTATAFILIMATQMAHSMENKITANTDVKAISSLSDKESQALSISAGRVLKHTESARQKVLDKNKEGALAEITQGLKLINIIENTAPKHKVVTDIVSEGITYHDEEEVTQRYVAVFNESFIDDIITPVIQTKKTGKSNKDNIIAPVKDYSVLSHTSVKLDVIFAKRKLMQAQKQLNKDNFDDAGLALASIQSSGIIFEFDEIELPLVEAAKNLFLSKFEANEGKYIEALATLKQASSDLKKYEELAGESRAAEVKKLHKEIDKMTKSLDGKKDLKSGMEKIEGKIASWWDRTVKWIKK